MSLKLYMPASREWAAISIALVLMILFLVYADWLWRWDQVIYDTQFRVWSTPPPEDIIIVAIDDASMSQLGRWPWSRGVHAELVKRLTSAGARAIALDIIFAEKDRRDPQGDQKLIDAVAASGRVVLPVVIEPNRLGGQLVETLPMPALTEAASALGHAHIDLDPDGIARRVHLLEGLGAPYWPAMSLALLRMIEPGAWERLPGNRSRSDLTDSPYNIFREHQMLIPFIGPPGHFPQISFSEVLNGRFLNKQFRDKIVLVGATSTGLGDDLPTPVSGRNQPMHGIEIKANIIDALRRGVTIEVMSVHWRMLFSGSLLLFTFLFFPRLPPKFVLLTTGSMILVTLLLSMLLLHGFQLWFPPTAVLIGLILGYPLWSWRRLEHTMRYFEQELARLDSEPKAVPFYGESLQLSQGLEFLRGILSFEGWVVRDRSGRIIESKGRLPDDPDQQIPDTGWLEQNNSLWISVPRDRSTWHLGLRKRDPAAVPRNAGLLLTEFIRQFSAVPKTLPRSAEEHIENQIRRIQSAIAELRTMRGLISDTLRQMLDGLLVINSIGQVVLANHQANRFFGRELDAELKKADILDLTRNLEIRGDISWNDALRDVLVRRKVVFMEARLTPGKELLIQMSPLSVEQGRLHGIIFLLSDVSLLKESERKRSEALHFLSHDLRSPITSMLSLVQMRHQENSPFGPDEITRRIEQYAKKALKLADDFLQLARAENADQASFEEADFVTIAHNAIDEVYPDAQRRRIRLIRRIEVDEAWIRADPGLLERALMNLLKNAIHCSGEGSTVELSLRGDEKEIRCCVGDRGKGIAAEDLDRIFEPFYRVQDSDSRNRRGTGLGLAFVKVVASKHQGSIGVESSPGKGSRFCLKIPYNGYPESARIPPL